jgi:CRP-like cAMP-binding protein
MGHVSTPVACHDPRFLPPDLVAQFVARGRAVRVRRGQVIIAEGAVTTDVYLVVSGLLQASVVSIGGRETIFRSIGPNELVGELAAIDQQERTATVVALKESVLSHLMAEQFRAYLSDVPMAGFWMARQLTDRVRDLSARAFEMANLTVSGRLIAELLRLALPAGADSQQGVISELPTHADLAARIGSNRESVTRELRGLTRQGLVCQSGRTLSIASLSKLQTLLQHQQR